MNIFKKFFVTNPIPKALIILAMLAISTLGYLNIRTAYQANICDSVEAYVWCEAKQKCLIFWEEECVSAAGGEMDINGCVGSAGYEWCTSKDQCIRPWEESCLGISGGKDAHGCDSADGDLWCEAKNKCIKPWEERCSSIAGGEMDEHGCVISAGYEWCANIQKCTRPWKEFCVEPPQKEKDAHGCVLSDGYAWCEAQEKCIKPSEEICTSTYEKYRDEKGCINAAGYEWCESKDKCFRPWEEGCVGFKPVEDQHGCDNEKGYLWCEAKDTCIQPWLEGCSSIAGGGMDEAGCLNFAGYAWCLKRDRCALPWEAGCEREIGEGEGEGEEEIVTKDKYGCITSDGFEWCEWAEKCIQPWMGECGESRPAPTENPFPDTDLSTLEGVAAAELFNRGIISGFPDGEFKGNRPVNRAEAAKILLLAASIELQLLDNSGVFSDVIDGEWYLQYVMTAAAEGVINGYPDGSFKPSDTVNTAEFLKMLTLAFGLEQNLSYAFIDVPSDAWFAQYSGTAELYNLFINRILYLFPNADLTRKDVAIAIYQYL